MMASSHAMLAVCVQGSYDQIRQQIEAGSKHGDVIEFRLDLMECDLTQIADLRKHCSLPVIFTLRSASHGGKFAGTEHERETILRDLMCVNPDYVDLEYDSDFAKKFIEDFPSRVKKIVSFHDFERTPENLEGILEEMRKIPGDIYKIAVTAQSSTDALRMLHFVKNNENVAGMCMGRIGEITRVLAPVVGSALTFGYVGEPTAPGQNSAEELAEVFRFKRLNRETEVYLIIGNPVDKSPGYLCHNKAFGRMGRNAVYARLPVKEEEVTDFFRLIDGLQVRGVTITMPLKECTMGNAPVKCDAKSEGIGAINTLTWSNGHWLGSNTDAVGALDAIEKGTKVAGKTVLILGGGGTAKAVATEAVDRGANVMIANRTLGKAELIASKISGRAISLDKVGECRYDVIVNTTSVGMAPNVDGMIIPESHIREEVVGLDAVMVPKKTRLLKAIRSKGGFPVYGHEMWIGQALRQYEAWGIDLGCVDVHAIWRDVLQGHGT